MESCPLKWQGSGKTLGRLRSEMMHNGLLTGRQAPFSGTIYPEGSSLSVLASQGCLFGVSLRKGSSSSENFVVWNDALQRVVCHQAGTTSSWFYTSFLLLFLVWVAAAFRSISWNKHSVLVWCSPPQNTQGWIFQQSGAYWKDGLRFSRILALFSWLWTLDIESIPPSQAHSSFPFQPPQTAASGCAWDYFKLCALYINKHLLGQRVKKN